MTPDDEVKEEHDNRSPEIRRRRFRKELLGIFFGLALAMMVSALIPQIREQFSLGIVILWGGALGGLLASYERFERAGAALTHRDQPALNYLVGLGIPVILLLTLYWLAR